MALCDYLIISCISHYSVSGLSKMLLLVFFCVFFPVATAGNQQCECPKYSDLTVTSVIPWFIATAALYLFYYHLTYNCDSKTISAIKQVVRDASAHGRRKSRQSMSEVAAKRVLSVSTAANSKNKSVRVLDVNNNITKARLKEGNLHIKGDQFRGYMQIATEFVIDYLRNNTDYNVTTGSKPGFIYKKLPNKMPLSSEKFSSVLNDLYEYILPGLAHWLHPQFHGYFPTGVSYPDIIADTIISSIGSVAFSWDSAPSLTELEVVMINWMGRAVGLPDSFLFTGRIFDSQGGGALQPSASDAVFVSVLAARNKKLREFVSLDDPDHHKKEAEILSKLVAYASVEAHTCIDKACNMAMVRLRSIPSSSDSYSLRGEALESEVKKDRERGLIPFHVHCTSGTTSIASFDDLEECVDVAKKYGMWVHVDAAYAGAALICHEFRYLMKGYELVDSININAHKMLLCSVTCAFFWTKHQAIIKETFGVEPLYLRKMHADSMDFRNWGISLSRRGKALKLWFLFRMYGLKHLQEYIRRLVYLTTRFKEHLKTDSRIELVGKQFLSLVCFHVKHNNLKVANERTNLLCEFINKSKRMLITHASPRDIDVVRICVSQERVTEKEIDESWEILKRLLDDFFRDGTPKQPHDSRFMFETDREVPPSPVATLELTQRTFSQESSDEA